jgi:hypothetical protein
VSQRRITLTFDDRTFIIALVVIVPFITVFSLVVLYRDLETLKTLSAIWAPWVGAVIGYFFGTRQVEVLIQKIEGITVLAEQRSRDLETEKQKVTEKRLENEQLVAELVMNNQRAENELSKAGDFIRILMQIINNRLPK